MGTLTLRHLARPRAIAMLVVAAALVGAVVYLVVRPSEEEKAAELRAAMIQKARAECDAIYEEFDDGAPADEVLWAYTRRHRSDFAVLRWMHQECPNTAQGLQAQLDREYAEINRRLGETSDSSPTWESEDCEQRYAAVSSDRFTAEESSTLREAVDMDCAGLSPSS